MEESARDGSGVASLDGDAEMLEKKSPRMRLPGRGCNPTAEVTDECCRFLSQRTQRFDGKLARSNNVAASELYLERFRASASIATALDPDTTQSG